MRFWNFCWVRRVLFVLMALPAANPLTDGGLQLIPQDGDDWLKQATRQRFSRYQRPGKTCAARVKPEKICHQEDSDLPQGESGKELSFDFI